MEIASQARLVICEGDNSRTVDIASFPFTIGRQPNSDLVLLHTRISRQHAVLQYDDRGYLLQDLGSRHGTFVNGVRRETVYLRSGDSIEFGISGATLVFLLPQDLRASTTHNLFTQFSADSTGSELEKLALFLRAAQSFNNAEVLQDILTTMLNYTLRLTGAERGFVFLGNTPDKLALEIGLNCEGLPLYDDSRISHSILRDAAESRQEFLLGDVSGDGKAVGRESIVAHELRSVIAIPLRGRGTSSLLGILYLDSRMHTSTLNRVGRDILSAIATEAALLVENARIVQIQRAADLLRNEMEIAASIQQSIIPRELPALSYANLMARTVQSKEVGGDFYEVIPLRDNGNAGFIAIVADVAGKGMPAALLASIIHGMMYAQVKSGTSLVDAVDAVNDFLCSRFLGRRYVTLIALFYEPSGHIEIVNGGHVSPYLVLEDGTVEPISDGDVPIGLFPGTTFHVVPFSIPLKARLVLLSDGITETENADGEQFGTTELLHQLRVSEPVDTIFSAVHQFSGGLPPHDDRTLLVIDRTA
jgi:serine phosphatase RsbU (regulator of sigma subunit)